MPYCGIYLIGIVFETKVIIETIIAMLKKILSFNKYCEMLYFT